MTKKKIIERLCNVCTTVMDHLDARLAANCFCGKNEAATFMNFQFDEKIIEFIEEAVAMRIRDQNKAVCRVGPSKQEWQHAN